MNLREWTSKISALDPKELRPTLCLLLIAATAAVYAQVGTHQFINYDDHLFVFENPHVYTGLSLANLKWAFTTLHGDASYWHPLTWLSHQLDCQLFGLRAGAHHLTNLWLHCANTVLLFIVLERMTGKTRRSLIVAALFQISDHVARFRDRLVAMPLEMQARGSVNVRIRDHHDQAVSDFRRWGIAVAANHSFSFDHRRRPEMLRTAIATAFFWPTSTTSRLPRVTPVYSRLRCSMA